MANTWQIEVPAALEYLKAAGPAGRRMLVALSVYTTAGRQEERHSEYGRNRRNNSDFISYSIVSDVPTAVGRGFYR